MTMRAPKLEMLTTISPLGDGQPTTEETPTTMVLSNGSQKTMSAQPAPGSLTINAVRMFLKLYFAFQMP